MARRIGSVTVMVLAVIGTLVCLLVLIGAWMARTPLTEGATAALESATRFLNLAEQATGLAAEVTGQTSDRLADTELRLEERSEERQAALTSLNEDITARIGPTLSHVRNVVTAAAEAVVAFNAALVAANRIPGVDLPTLTTQLEAIQTRLTALEARMNEIRASVDAILPDGTPVRDAVGQAANDFDDLSMSLGSWSDQLGATSTAATQLQAALPGMLTWLVVGISLLMLLLGAGQISLFAHALEWFRRV